jgi:hypothetical protein
MKALAWYIAPNGVEFFLNTLQYLYVIAKK